MSRNLCHEASVLSQDSEPGTQDFLFLQPIHSRKPFVSRFFTVFTFVSPSIHDFHAKKISARISVPRNQIFSESLRLCHIRNSAQSTFLSQVIDLTFLTF